MKRKPLFLIALLCLDLSATWVHVQAQEKVMKVIRKNGTTSQTRVAELKQISFLTLEEGGQGLIVKTLSGEMAAVRFEARPIVTASNGKLTVRSTAEEPIELEISDISEIIFGDVAEVTAIDDSERFAFIMQDRTAILRGIPKGVKPCIYALDGRTIPTPSLQGNELRLTRATLGSGFFIVKVGSFSTKIHL